MWSPSRFPLGAHPERHLVGRQQCVGSASHGDGTIGVVVIGLCRVVPPTKRLHRAHHTAKPILCPGERQRVRQPTSLSLVVVGALTAKPSSPGACPSARSI